MDVNSYTILFVTVVLLGSTLQGFTGFGSGLVIMGILTQFADARTLIPQVALVCASLTLTMLVQLRGHLRWREALPLCSGIIIGTLVGVAVFANLPSSVIRRIVGGTLIMASVMGLLRPGLLHFLRQRFWAYPLGFMGGCISAFNTSGPPLIHYAYAQDWTIEQKKMVLQSAFLVSMAIRLTQFTCAGLYTAETIKLPLIGIPVAVFGVIAGHALSRRVRSKVLTKVVYVALVFLGVLLVARTPTS